jgi:hypothetical protein
MVVECGTCRINKNKDKEMKTIRTSSGVEENIINERNFEIGELYAFKTDLHGMVIGEVDNFKATKDRINTVVIKDLAYQYEFKDIRFEQIKKFKKLL